MTPSARRPFPWLPLVSAVLFAAAYTQPPLYFSNQNQYFLHGLAAAGVGDLRTDWLANTTDPTPAFSKAVELTVRFVGEWPFYAAFFALLTAYFLGLWGVAAALPFFPQTTAGRAAFAAGLIAVHSSVVRVASAHLLGVDYPWYFQAGVAHQYVLGAGLQPSAFGVLLIAALAAFAHGRPGLAGALAAAACLVHSTYLLPAGLLVGGMVIGLAWDGRRRAAAACGGIALLLAAPAIAFTATAFAPTDPDTFARAQEVIARERIPHHTDVNRWLDWVGGVQLAWLAAGVIAFRRTPLFVPLAVAAGGGLLLSLAQIASGNATFALCFPWRVSAVLVPVATAAALAGLARVAEGERGTLVPGVPDPSQEANPDTREGSSRLRTRGTYIPRSPVLWTAAALIVAPAVLGAAWVYTLPLGAGEAELIRAVRSTRQPGDVYLFPASLPPPSAKRGVGSLTFVPPKPGRPAVFELERFRLATGAAVYVDSKAIPYRDVEVLEWRRRVANCERWYASADWDVSGNAAAIAAEGVTHVVVPAGVTVHSRRFELVHEDAAHRVYRVRPDR